MFRPVTSSVSAFEGLQELPARKVPDPYRGVVASRHNLSAIWSDCYDRDVICVAVHCEDKPPGGKIPDSKRVVIAAGHSSSIGRDGDRLDAPGVTLESALKSPGPQIPHPHGLVVAA